MGKRARITALITTLCLCLSLFVVGVLAATSATFNVTSTLNFTADGVYVMVDASLKQGADVSSAQVLSGTEAPTGQTTYKAYSYPRMATGTTPDAPNGQPSTTHFVNESGAQASSWAIGDINYTSTNKVVVYEFMIYNYSNFEVTGMVSGVSDVLSSYVSQGQLSITTYTGTTSADATATGSPTYSFTIPARTSETTPGQACYKIAVTLNNFMINLATGQIEMDINFCDTNSLGAIDFVQWNSSEEYYYLEMGELSDGTPLEWRLVLERTDSEADPTDSTVDGVTEAGFTGDKTELEGKTYYFLLNTWTGGTNFSDSPDACSFNNYYTNGYNSNYSGNAVSASDYASSTIRKYITGTKVLRSFANNAPAPHTSSGQTEDTPDDFLSKYSIEENPVYNLIEGRTLADLYTKMGRPFSNPSNIEYNATVAAGDSTLGTAAIPNTVVDKLWLLSNYEAYEITGSDSSSNAGVRVWNSDYWLRTPRSSAVYYVWPSGEFMYEKDDASGAYCARPAFMMSF